MDIVQEWVPSEEEVPEDHWSKSPEYIAEKAAAVHPGQGFVVAGRVLPATRSKTTHDLAKESFTKEYVKTDDDIVAEEKSIRAEVSADVDIYEQMAIDMLAKIDAAVKAKEDADLPS